jgi:hypothetical protein
MNWTGHVNIKSLNLVATPVAMQLRANHILLKVYMLSVFPPTNRARRCFSCTPAQLNIGHYQSQRCVARGLSIVTQSTIYSAHDLSLWYISNPYVVQRIAGNE